jgi:hypothetical protein
MQLNQNQLRAVFAMAVLVLMMRLTNRKRSASP